MYPDASCFRSTATVPLAKRKSIFVTVPAAYHWGMVASLAPPLAWQLLLLLQLQLQLLTLPMLLTLSVHLWVLLKVVLLPKTPQSLLWLLPWQQPLELQALQLYTLPVVARMLRALPCWALVVSYTAQTLFRKHWVELLVQAGELSSFSKLRLVAALLLLLLPDVKLAHLIRTPDLVH